MEHNWLQRQPPCYRPHCRYVGTYLYSFVNGGSLDLEFSLNAGAVFTKHEEYEKVDNTYVVTKSASNYKLNWSPLPYLLINDVLKVSLVYHFGPSVANRYKKRITIDERYRYHLGELKMQRDSANLARQHDKEMRRDSLEKLDYERRFEKQRLELERKYLNDSISQIKKQKAAETKGGGRKNDEVEVDIVPVTRVSEPFQVQCPTVGCIFGCSLAGGADL